MPQKHQVAEKHEVGDIGYDRLTFFCNRTGDFPNGYYETLTELGFVVEPIDDRLGE